MEILKPSLIAATALLAGCGQVTRVDYVDTDTYISSSDPANHSELTYMRVSGSPTLEERALIKLPTGERDVDLNIEKMMEALVLWPYYIFAAIFESMFDCAGKGIAADNLTNAKLLVDVTQNTSGASLSNLIQLELLAKPWWQNASWNLAHGFSLSGHWNAAGGDLDTSLAPILATHTGSVTSGTLEFDVTSYFKTLLANEQTPHFGMVLRSVSGSLASVAIASTQYGTSSSRPRVQSTYNCVQVNGTMLREADNIKTHTYILGPR